jgi:hypothetical protein
MQVADAGATMMPTTLKNATEKYVQARNLFHGTRSEYKTTVAKCQRWKGRVPIEKLDRPTIREFLSWVHDRSVADGGTNPGRTSNKARTHLRAVISWTVAGVKTHLPWGLGCPISLPETSSFETNDLGWERGQGSLAATENRNFKAFTSGYEKTQRSSFLALACDFRSYFGAMSIAKRLDRVETNRTPLATTGVL